MALTKFYSESIKFDQSQGNYRPSRHSRKGKHHVQQMHSTEGRRDNGLEADGAVDKDSGESSQKMLNLDFSKLKAKSGNATPERVTMKHVKKSEEPSRSLWSSSNDLDIISPLELSLKHLNFSSLVNNPNDNEKSNSDNTNNVSLRDDQKSSEEDDDEEEKKVVDFSGYETPYLGLKITPSYENLRKCSDAESSLEEIYTHQGNKIMPLRKAPLMQDDSLEDLLSDSMSSVNTPNKYKPVPKDSIRNYLVKNTKAKLPKCIESELEKESEEEINYNFKPQKNAPSKRERSSNYRESIQGNCYAWTKINFSFRF